MAAKEIRQLDYEDVLAFRFARRAAIAFGAISRRLVDRILPALRVVQLRARPSYTGRHASDGSGNHSAGLGFGRFVGGVMLLSDRHHFNSLARNGWAFWRDPK